MAQAPGGDPQGLGHLLLGLAQACRAFRNLSPMSMELPPLWFYSRGAGGKSPAKRPGNARKSLSKSFDKPGLAQKKGAVRPGTALFFCVWG